MPMRCSVLLLPQSLVVLPEVFRIVMVSVHELLSNESQHHDGNDNPEHGGQQTFVMQQSVKIDLT